MKQKEMTSDTLSNMKYLQEQLNHLRNKHYDLSINVHPKRDIVTCERCKCLLLMKDAHKGESEIRERSKMRSTIISSSDGHQYGPTGLTEEYIHVPYYCQKCKPKPRKT